MPKRRNVRRLAMQLLYQFDLGGEADEQAVLAGLEDAHDAPAVRRAAVTLATGAWRGRAEADRRIAELTPDWPTHRQPPVDRAILRLAHHEMVSGHAPAKVAINEAVELAKRYADEQSPSFINGVLDKLAKRLDREGQLPANPLTADDLARIDPWLDDALNENDENGPPS
ncbi:MAG: transcription antitermination factor NusB [Phycisphaeraceae bacterium]